MTEILRIENLSAGYGPLGVLHGINLNVKAGERIGIIGLNGHGKSTLLRSIAGLTGWQSGSIKLNGVEVGGVRSSGSGRNTHKIVRMGLALMPQGDALFHGLTVADHLDSGAYTRRAWRERMARRKRVLEIFPPLGKLLGVATGKLSGGERRMVSLARGLMADASLILVDEPSLGLAPKISKSVVEALMRIDLRDGAMVIAEQNLSLLDGKVNRLIQLHAGKLKGGAAATLSLGGHGLSHSHPSSEAVGGRMNVDFYYLILTTASLAAIYGLLALGISIIWSSLGMINMAHGFTSPCPATGRGSRAISGNHAFIVLAGGVLTGMASGALICALAFIPLYDKPNYALRGLIATLAISLLGAQGLLWAFGPRVKALPKIFGVGTLKFGTVVASYDKIGTIVTATVLLLAVLVWMKTSRRGLEIRAMMQNPEGAALVGVGLRSTAFSVMIVTGGLAGLAAVLLSQNYFVSPYSGTTPLVKGMVVALAGGLGSISGALIAAVLVALVEALTAVQLGGQYVLITQFLFIILVLLIRPRGIGGMLQHARV